MMDLQPLFFKLLVKTSLPKEIKQAAELRYRF